VVGLLPLRPETRKPEGEVGEALDLAAMLLGGGVLARHKIGTIAREKSALTTLLGILIVKFILGLAVGLLAGFCEEIG